MDMTEITAEGAFDATVRRQINENFAKLEAAPEIVTKPAAADSAGAAGQIAFEDGVLYICIAANTWQKVVIATW